MKKFTSLAVCIAFLFAVQLQAANEADIETAKTDLREILKFAEERGYGVWQKYEFRSPDWTNIERFMNMRRARNLAVWTRVAESGTPEGQVLLGLVHFHGMGVPVDEFVGVDWLRRAAEQGYADAQYHLGICYTEGIGVPQDNTEARKWFGKFAEQLRKTAEEGDAEAQIRLGTFYLDGMIIPPDEAMAVIWYEKAAEQGNVQAQFLLGTFYLDGIGVPEDIEQAEKWLRKAEEQGHENATTMLQDLADRVEVNQLQGELVTLRRQAEETLQRLRQQIEAETLRQAQAEEQHRAALEELRRSHQAALVEQRQQAELAAQRRQQEEQLAEQRHRAQLAALQAQQQAEEADLRRQREVEAAQLQQAIVAERERERLATLQKQRNNFDKFCKPGMKYAGVYRIAVPSAPSSWATDVNVSIIFLEYVTGAKDTVRGTITFSLPNGRIERPFIVSINTDSVVPFPATGEIINSGVPSTNTADLAHSYGLTFANDTVRDIFGSLVWHNLQINIRFTDEMGFFINRTTGLDLSGWASNRLAPTPLLLNLSPVQ